MAEKLIISKEKPDHPSMDYSFLREAGMKQIRKLAAGIWTDHNSHDPGITLLEVLCYAITDLGYRCNFSIQDLLASDPENQCGPSPQFFQAAEILPNHPLTINDFRKILIDLPGVRNAWLEKSEHSEIPVFYDALKDELTYSKTSLPVDIKGLYRAAVEFSEDDILGDLNSNLVVIPVEFMAGTETVTAEAEILFPGWDEIKPHWKTELKITKISLHIDRTDKFPFHFSVSAGVKIKDRPVNDHFQLWIRIRNVRQEWLKSSSTLETVLAGRIQKTGETGLFGLFNQRLLRIGTLTDHCRNFLDSHRNLCEDFLEVTPVKIQEVALNAEFELPLDADVERLLAEIFFQVHCFLDPPIRFYTLAERLNDGISPENIFEGPLLKNGFIADENLIAFRNRDALYTSDLVNLIMVREGIPVVAIKGLALSNYIDNTPISSGSGNCLFLFRPDIYRPKLSVEKSSILCKKKGVPVTYDPSKVLEKYRARVRESEPVKMGHAQIQLTLPSGKNRKISSYTALAENLPPVYGVGQAGLPDTATAERKAKASQLKGYLLFFDQLFIQFLNQLSNVKNLFSIDEEVNKTYFEKTVFDVPGSMMLIREFIKDQPSLDDESALEAAWNLFSSDPGNAYSTELKNLTENEQTFRSRRNRFLDHLLARFCEDFTDYSLLLLAGNHQEVQPQLLEQKIAFLKELPILGSERGKGFDTSIAKDTGMEVWDTSNVTGLEKRGTRLLGFENYNRRFLTKGDYRHAEFYQETDEDGINEFRFRIRDNSKKILLSSTGHWPDLEQAYVVILQVLDLGKAPGNYRVKTTEEGKFYFNLYDENEDPVARRVELFNTDVMAQAEIDRVSGFLATHFEGVGDEPGEGFHVVEQLLLRPGIHKKINGKEISDPLLPTLPDEYGNPVEEGRDPYSSRITVVFPAGLAKFKDPNFKDLAERILRLETPAHVMPQVAFLNNIQLSHFEYAYKAWLELAVTPRPEDPVLLAKFLVKMNQSLKTLFESMVFVPPPPGVD